MGDKIKKEGYEFDTYEQLVSFCTDKLKGCTNISIYMPKFIIEEIIENYDITDFKKCNDYLDTYDDNQEIYVIDKKFKKSLTIQRFMDSEGKFYKNTSNVCVFHFALPYIFGSEDEPNDDILNYVEAKTSIVVAVNESDECSEEYKHLEGIDSNEYEMSELLDYIPEGCNEAMNNIINNYYEKILKGCPYCKKNALFEAMKFVYNAGKCGIDLDL